MKCAEVRLFQREFIKETATELLRKNDKEVENKYILDMLVGIAKYLESRDSDEHKKSTVYRNKREISRVYCKRLEWGGLQLQKI